MNKSQIDVFVKKTAEEYQSALSVLYDAASSKIDDIIIFKEPHDDVIATAQSRLEDVQCSLSGMKVINDAEVFYKLILNFVCLGFVSFSLDEGGNSLVCKTSRKFRIDNIHIYDIILETESDITFTNKEEDKIKDELENDFLEQDNETINNLIDEKTDFVFEPNIVVSASLDD